jgi:ABC-2 type transport system ATP-binding protein
MIRIEQVTKRYRSTLALNQLSLTVPPGSILGLLGPNGAGKSTFMRIIMRFVFPDSGRVDWGDLIPADIGYLSERALYPPRFGLRHYLTLQGQLAGLQGRTLRRAIDDLIEQVGLQNVADRKLGACSRGMLQRLGLAQALLGDPPLLLLDEPVLGLDPAGQKFMRNQIVDLRQRGKTVVLASHHLDEVTRVCTHVAVLKEGSMVHSGALESILAPRSQITIHTGPLPESLAVQLAGRAPDIVLSEGGLTLTGTALSDKAQVLRMLLDADVDIRKLEEQHSTLEEVFLEATGA